MLRKRSDFIEKRKEQYNQTSICTDLFKAFEEECRSMTHCKENEPVSNKNINICSNNRHNCKNENQYVIKNAKIESFLTRLAVLIVSSNFFSKILINFRLENLNINKQMKKLNICHRGSNHNIREKNNHTIRFYFYWTNSVPFPQKERSVS